MSAPVVVERAVLSEVERAACGTRTAPRSVIEHDPVSAEGTSEAASEKPRRGRSRLTNAKQDELISGFNAPDVKTRRGQLKVHYRQRALGMLMHHRDELTWIVPRGIEAGTGGLRFGILAALGRIEDPESMLAWAQAACERRPRVKDFAACVRRWRTGRITRNADQLAKAVVRTVNDYLERYPDISREQIVKALSSIVIPESEPTQMTERNGCVPPNEAAP